jgi:hypothetical protein
MGFSVYTFTSFITVREASLKRTGSSDLGNFLPEAVMESKQYFLTIKIKFLMANINENLLVRGARGNVGKQFVYKKHGDNTNIARMPSINKNAVPTEKQAQKRELFSEAASYAQGAMSSADLKKEYEKKSSPGKTAFNIALRDYLKAPVVKKIDTSNYKGTIGSVIVVNAKDDFRVAELQVTIHSATGVLLEEGKAVLDPIKRSLWNYTVTQNNAILAGSVVNAIATDLPGNTGSLAITM